MRIIPIELVTPNTMDDNHKVLELEINSQIINSFSGTLSVEDLLGQGWANCGGCTRLLHVGDTPRENC